MLKQRPLNGGQSISRIIHDVEAGTAMNVEVNIGRSKQGVTKVDGAATWPKRTSRNRRDLADLPVVYPQDSIPDAVGRHHQHSGSESLHINVLILANGAFRKLYPLFLLLATAAMVKRGNSSSSCVRMLY